MLKGRANWKFRLLSKKGQLKSKETKSPLDVPIGRPESKQEVQSFVCKERAQQGIFGRCCSSRFSSVVGKRGLPDEDKSKKKKGTENGGGPALDAKGIKFPKSSIRDLES